MRKPIMPAVFLEAVEQLIGEKDVPVEPPAQETPALAGVVTDNEKRGSAARTGCGDAG